MVAGRDPRLEVWSFLDAGSHVPHEVWCLVGPLLAPAGMMARRKVEQFCLLQQCRVRDALRAFGTIRASKGVGW